MHAAVGAACPTCGRGLVVVVSSCAASDGADVWRVPVSVGPWPSARALRAR